MKVGITGGAGYIGSYLITKLIESGNEVVSIDNEKIGDYKLLRELSLPNLTLVNGDIKDKEKLIEIWKDCEVVIHLAALSNLEICNEYPQEAIDTNIYGTYQVMEAVKILGIKKVINCSSAAVYGEPSEIPISENTSLNAMNLYGITKIAAEKIVNSYWINNRIETVNLRFGNIYGVGLYTPLYAVIPKFVDQAMSGKDITIYGDGESTRDYIHINDIIRAIIKIMETGKIGGETYNLGGETLTVNQIAEMIVSEIKKITDIEPNVINTTPRIGETKEFSYDLSKIRNEIGFENEWTVHEGIRQLVKHHLKE